MKAEGKNKGLWKRNQAEIIETLHMWCVWLKKKKKSRLIDRNLVLEEKAASQHVGPSLAPGPPESQTAPSVEAETSGTDRSGGERNVSVDISSVWENAGQIALQCVSCDSRRKRTKVWLSLTVIFESNLTNICDVFLWWQAECRQVLCVALSNARRLLSLSTNQTAGGEIKIDAARSTLNTKGSQRRTQNCVT